jgi:TIR domain
MTERVFLSYAREDIVVATRLYTDLSSIGVSVWFDKEHLRPGERWKLGITRAIRDSGYFLAVLSEASIDKRGYFQRELKEALDVLREVPEHKTFIIPVRTEECEPTNPELLELQFVDLFPSYEAGLEKLKSVLAPRVADSQATSKALQLGSKLRLRYCRRFGDESRQLVHGIAADREGHTIIVGDFWGTLDFGGSVLVSAGDRDIFLAKFDYVGKHIWSKRFGDRAEQVGVSVAADDRGAVFLAGAFSGSMNMGGETLTSKGRYNISLAKLDRDGEHLWSRSFGDENYHVPECIAVAPSGLVVMAGRFRGVVDFGGGEIRSASQQTDVFIAAFSPDGEFIWAKRIGGPFEQQTRSLAIDERGNIGLAGVFKGEIAVDGQALRQTRSTDYCGFLASLNHDGNAVWCKRIGEPPAEQVSAVAYDSSDGGMLAAGFIRNNLPNERQRQTSSVCLLARYDQAGLLQWSRTFGPRAFADTISVAPDGLILLTGHFEGSLDLGLGPLVSAGGYDVFAALVTRDGRTLWCSRFGDQWQQFLIAGAHLKDGSIALTGSFHGTVDFGWGPLVAAGYAGTGQGTEDVFLAIFDQTGN